MPSSRKRTPTFASSVDCDHGARVLDGGVGRISLSQVDSYSPRHASASLARIAVVSGFLLIQAMGHTTSGLGGQVNADALPTGIARLAEHVAERAFGTKTSLRVIAGGKPPNVSLPLARSAGQVEADTASA